MVDIIPLQPVPSQQVTVTLGGQSCQINIRQARTGMFLDLYINNVLVLAGGICQNRNRIVRSAYIGLVGDLMFCDASGSDDPTYTGLGSRFLLAYLAPGDVL